MPDFAPRRAHVSKTGSWESMSHSGAYKQASCCGSSYTTTLCLNRESVTFTDKLLKQLVDCQPTAVSNLCRSEERSLLVLTSADLECWSVSVEKGGEDRLLWSFPMWGAVQQNMSKGQILAQTPIPFT